MDIYEETAGFKAYQDQAALDKAPVDVPEDAIADETAGHRVTEETGFAQNLKSSFVQSYRSVGLGSYNNIEEESYAESYRKLGQGGHLRAMGIQDDSGALVSPVLEYDKNKDVIEKYIAEHPELNLKTGKDIQDQVQAEYERDAQDAAATRERASMFSGNAGHLAGVLFGAMTDPLQLAINYLPVGSIAKGVSIAKQIPSLLMYNTLAATAGSVVSKGRDIAYRRDVLKEDTDKANIPLEILQEGLIGGAVGAGLIAGGAVIGRAFKGRMLGKVAGELDLDNPYTPEIQQNLKTLEKAKALEEANPGDPRFQLSEDQDDALSVLRTIDDVLDQKPEDVSQAEYIKSLSRAQAELETPIDAIRQLRDQKNYGEITPDDEKYLDELFGENKRFDEDQSPQAIERFPQEEQDMLNQEHIDATIEEFRASNADDPYTEEVIGTYKADQNRIDQLDRLETCLLTPKPRVRA